MRLCAALIVRDEAARITHCLAALSPLVEQIVVYDTGSVDGTRELAAAAGATVIAGKWGEDFSRARNAALPACAGDWVLSVDADEMAAGDRELLLAGLGGAESAGYGVLGVVTRLSNSIDNGGDYLTRLPRLFRRAGAVWTGRVHERVGHEPASRISAGWLAGTALNLRHEGYADPLLARAKARRNLTLGLREVEALSQAEDPARLAQALFDVGRSLVGMGLRAQSLEPFADVRALSPVGSPLWAQATDFLARQHLALGDNDRALEVAEQLLTAAPEHAEYGRWLLGQALVALGQFRPAADVLAVVEVVVDPAGRVMDPLHLAEFRSLLGQLLAVEAGQRAVLG